MKHLFSGHWFYRKMWIFATTDILFYPYLFYTVVWLPALPWFVGYVTDIHVGYVFAWGTFVNDHFVLGTFSYFYGWLHLISFNLPLIFVLANAADLRYIFLNFLILKMKKKVKFVNYYI